MTPKPYAGYQIVRAQTAKELERRINETEETAVVQIHGAPFHDNQTGQWCQAVTLRSSLPAGQVKLKEPKR